MAANASSALEERLRVLGAAGSGIRTGECVRGKAERAAIPQSFVLILSLA